MTDKLAGELPGVPESLEREALRAIRVRLEAYRLRAQVGHGKGGAWLDVWAYDGHDLSAPTDTVRYRPDGPPLGPGGQPQPYLVWGPNREHRAALRWPAAAAAAIVQTFGRVDGQLPRATFTPAEVKAHRYRSRRQDPNLPYRVWAPVLVAATPLGVPGARATRLWNRLELGEVARQGPSRWLAVCHGCPAERPTRLAFGRRGDAMAELAAHYVARHVEIRQLGAD